MNATADEIRQKHTATSRAGFFLLCLYLFMVFSRSMEILLPGAHLTAILYGLTLFFAVITGGLKRAFSNRAGIMLVAFSVWLMIATPFSMWKGGSVGALLKAARTFPVFLLVAGLALDVKHCRKAIHAIAFGTLTLSIFSFFIGEIVDGRFQLAYGKFANPNDMAQVLLMALPFWWLAASDPASDRVRRLAAAAAGILLVVVMARTGSRAAFLSATATMLVYFWKASNRGRLTLAAGCIIGLAVAAAIMSGELRARYFTFFEADATEVRSEEEQFRIEQAIGSARARAQLLEASINLTLNFPIFGVGPGMFQVGEEALAETQGRRAAWHESHNTYTQVSSEAGLPALFFYTAFLWFSLRACFRVFRDFRRRPEFWGLANSAFAVLLSLVSYAICTLFISLAYEFFLPCLAGFAVCLDRAAEQAKQAAQAPPAAPPVGAIRRLPVRLEPRRRRLVSP